MMRVQPVLRWPRVRSLAFLLQSPAHRAVRVLGVTASNWHVSGPHLPAGEHAPAR